MKLVLNSYLEGVDISWENLACRPATDVIDDL